MESINLNSRAKKLTALILACIVYLLIVSLLLLDLCPILNLGSPNPLKEQPSVPIMQQVARKNPAPVRYMQQPAQSAQAQQQRPVPQAQAKPLPKSQERTLQTQQTATTSSSFLMPPDESQKEEEPIEQENAEPARKPRSRTKWYKEGTAPEEQTATGHNFHPSKMAQLADGFHEHMRKQYDKNLPTGVRGAADGSVDPKAIEYGMFLYRFDHQLCDESRMRPLPLHARLIQPHTIQIAVTISRARKVTDVKFVKPSYEEQINDYVRDLLYAMTAPQLPASYAANTAILQLNIRLDRMYHQDKLWLCPVDSM